MSQDKQFLESGMRPSSEVKNESQIERYCARIGKSEAVDRFILKYGSLNTRKAYLLALPLYFEWLRTKGITLTHDELFKDNLECIFNSDPTDVQTKRKHTDWIAEYVNGYILKQGYSEKMREVVYAAVKMFYKRNDSPLFGDFQLA